MNTHEKLEEKLSPESIKKNLTLAALYITAYETLKLKIIGCVQNANFITFDTSGGFGEDLEKTIKKSFENQYKDKYGEYKSTFKNSEIRVPLDKQLGMSCLWLVDNDVIDVDEVGDIERITNHRNELAHKLPMFLIDLDLEVNLDYLVRIVEMFVKVDQWMIEVEKSITPDPEAREAHWYSGSGMILQQVILAALSEE